MKTSFRRWMWLLAPVAALLSSAALAAGPPGLLVLPEFESLSRRATETVNISLDPALLGLAAGFLDSSQPDEAATKDLVAGLKGIYVRSYTFAEDFAYPADEVERVRAQLTGPGWQRLIQVNNTKDRSHVDIFMCADHGVAQGLAIISSEPRQFTIVNIVGSIDLAKLHRLEGKFGIPKIAVPDNGGGKDDRQQGK